MWVQTFGVVIKMSLEMPTSRMGALESSLSSDPYYGFPVMHSLGGSKQWLKWETKGETLTEFLAPNFSLAQPYVFGHLHSEHWM